MLSALIYEAASAPEQWGDIVRKIKIATRSHFGMLWLGKPNCSVEEFAANQGDFLAFEHENSLPSLILRILCEASGSILDRTVRANCASCSVGSGSSRTRICSDRRIQKN